MLCAIVATAAARSLTCLQTHFYFWNASRPASTAASKSVSRSFLNGRDMSSKFIMTLDLPPSFKVTTKEPLRGRSSLILTLKPAAFRRVSATTAFFLNTCQLLQCSIVAPSSPELAVTSSLAAGAALAALAAGAFALEVVAFRTALALGDDLATILDKINLLRMIKTMSMLVQCTLIRF